MTVTTLQHVTMEDIDAAVEQHENSKKEHHLKPYQFQKGKSGNPSGRPKGTVSLKEYARKMLQELDDEGKLEFMNGLSKDTIWEMAEGKAKQDTEIKATVSIASVLDTLESDGQETPGQGLANQSSVQDTQQSGQDGPIQAQ